MDSNYTVSRPNLLQKIGRDREINRASGNKKGYSAKATEVEAGQRPVPPRTTPAQYPSSFHSQCPAMAWSISQTRPRL
jgi:hypothetical protein